MSRSIYFFATKRDIEPLLVAIESKHEIKYVRAGNSDSPEVVTLSSGLQIPNLGIAESGDWNHNQWWLLMKPSATVQTRTISLRRGGTRYAIDQRLNPNSIAFEPGGIFQDNVVIGGTAGTISDEPVSRELINLFTRETRRQFTRIRSFFVGPEAEKLLDKGYRLTTDTRSTQEYDLARP